MIHGGDIYTFEQQTGKTPLDFSENTNPFGLPRGVQTAIVEAMGRYQAYPDPLCRALAEAVSKHHDLPTSYLTFGNGAADLIFKLAYGIKPKTALVLAPTFAEYQLALEQVCCQVSSFLLQAETQFTVSEQILSAVDGKDVVFICNPNNPTGQLCERELLLKLAKRCQEQGSVLVVDECFMDFVPQKEGYSLLHELEHLPSVVLLKAFTKLYAMAGIRLGYAICSNAELLSQIQSQGQPWSVSTVAQVAGIAACQETAYVTESLAKLEVEKQFLEQSLTDCGFQVFPSHANYLLFTAPEDLGERLFEQGIMIRHCGNYEGLHQGYYRIGIKRHDDNLTLIGAIKHG